MSIYKENGFENRRAYLESLAKNTHAMQFMVWLVYLAAMKILTD